MSRASPRFHRVNPSLPAVGTSQGVTLYRVVGSFENQLTISTFYYLAPLNNPTTAQLTTLLTSITSTMFLAYKNCVSSDWTCTKETLDVVHRNDIIGVQSLANANVPGTRPSGHEPTEVASIIIRYSAFKGQHGRGRVSLPAASTADVTSSRLSSSAIQTNLTTLAGAMLNTATDGTNTWTPCIAQRSNTSPKNIVAAAAMVRTVPNFLLGTVRRRRIGRGK